MVRSENGEHARASEEEAALWLKITEKDDPDHYRFYLKQYGEHAFFADEARAKLREIDGLWGRLRHTGRGSVLALAAVIPVGLGLVELYKAVWPAPDPPGIPEPQPEPQPPEPLPLEPELLPPEPEPKTTSDARVQFLVRGGGQVTDPRQLANKAYICVIEGSPSVETLRAFAREHNFIGKIDLLPGVDAAVGELEKSGCGGLALHPDQMQDALGKLRHPSFYVVLEEIVE